MEIDFKSKNIINTGLSEGSKPQAYEILIAAQKSIFFLGTERVLYLENQLKSVLTQQDGDNDIIAPKNLLVGKVIDVGAAVKSVSAVRNGQRILIKAAQKSHHCVNVLSDGFYLLPDEISDEEALFIQPACLILGAIKQAGGIFAKTTGIVGMGILGQMATQIITGVGFGSLILEDILEYRKQIGKQLIDSIRTLAGGNRTCDLVIDTSGTESGFKRSLALAKEKAIILSIGCYRKEFNLNFYKDVIVPGICIQGIHARHIFDTPILKNDLLREVVLLLQHKIINISEFFYHEVTPVEVSASFFELNTNPYKYLSIIVNWNG